jgi:hypothetical protein
MAPDPDRVRVRADDIVATYPDPPPANTYRPVARGPNVRGARSRGDYLHLGRRGSLGHDDGVCRCCGCNGRLRCHVGNRSIRGLRWCRVGGLRLISINRSSRICRWSLICRDIFNAVLDAARGEDQNAAGREHQKFNFSIYVLFHNVF